MTDILLIAIFACHLLAVDLAAAGPLVAIWLEWRATRQGDALAGEIGRRVAIWSLATAVIGVGLGLLTIVALPKLEPEAYRQAFGRVTPYLWWSIVGELAFYLGCIAAYIFFWQRWKGLRYWHRTLAVLAATNLLYHFPTLFTIISALSMRPQLSGLPLDGPLFRKMLLDGEVISRVAHHWLAAVAVAGTFAMWLAARAGVPALAGRLTAGPGPTGAGTPRPAPPRPEGCPGGTPTGPGAATIVRRSARIALVATTAQILVGVWLLFELPPAMQNQVLGEDLTATALFGVSIVAALGLMHHLSIVALGDVSRRTVGRAALLIVLVVLLMVATLHRARERALEPARVSLAVGRDRAPTVDLC